MSPTARLPKADFSKVDASKLTLVETVSMDESVLQGNITRVVENLCHDELSVLNRGVGFLLGKPDLATDMNPLGPATIVGAFSGAVGSLQADRKIKFQIMKDLNQAQLGDIATIYADLNKHLTRHNVVPAPGWSGAAHRAASSERTPAKAPAKPPPPPPGTTEVDVMAMFKRMYGSATPSAAPALRRRAPRAAAVVRRRVPASAAGHGRRVARQISLPGGSTRTFAPLRPTPSGYVPGAPIISTADLHEGLTRLQAGQTDFDVGGAAVGFSGIPQGLHNVLRDLQESPLGARANQLESMTIEMVAMLFDFIFETKDLPDGIKALLARLQIPVLKAAMLDGAFFAKKSHPSRLLVNQLAQAGLGWSPVMGQEDPLYRQIDAIVHQILDNFSDDLTIFDEQRVELEAFLAEEEKAAEENIQSTADEINQKDRLQIASVVAKAEIEKRIEASPVPNFLASFLRQNWQGTLQNVYLEEGEESESWGSGVNDARGPRVERAAEEDAGGPPAPGRAAAVAAEAPVRGHAQPPLGRRGPRSVHVESGRGARRSGEALAGADVVADLRGGRSREGAGGTREGRGRRRDGGEGRSARGRDDAGRAGAGASPNARSSPTTTSRSRAASSAACGSSSRRTTVNSPSRSSRG